MCFFASLDCVFVYYLSVYDQLARCYVHMGSSCASAPAVSLSASTAAAIEDVGDRPLVPLSVVCRCPRGS